MIIIIGDYILLGGFKLGDEVLDCFGVEKHFRNADLINVSSCVTDMDYEWSLL